MATGGIYVFKKLPTAADREVPDTFHLLAEYAKGHSLVLSSSMANDTHIPGLIRGHEGTIIMVDHGAVRAQRPVHHGEAAGTAASKAIGGEAYCEQVRH